MNYIALTIGPIYKTLQNARNPKGLFASSYIFSYIMREIIREFSSREFIVPYIKDKSIFEDGDIGLFHDRFIFKSCENDIYKLKSVIDEVIEDVANKLDIEFLSVKDYLQINYDEYTIDESKNPILEISPYLDTSELFFKTTQDSSFINSLKREKGDKDNFLTASKNIVDDLQKLCSKNYFATVHIDADNMGSVIASKDNLEKVSKNLFNYCKSSAKLVKEFGGQTIFAGGDDLLFFAPVMSKDRTIFNLCDEISKDFDVKFKGEATLSFGVGITYIKHPLYEALESSRELLFNKAKSGSKNNIAFKVIKHSGQTFETIVHKGNPTIYSKFLAISSSIQEGKDGVDNFLHSLHHKIDTHKTTLNEIAKDREKLINFFANYFNKDEHKQYEEFFQLLTDFIYEVFKDENIEKKDKLNLIYSTLRFVKFVKGDKS